MHITALYERYEIPPWLADHQLTVAGVASVVCAKTSRNEADDIVAACLLHDMGNLIKFDLDRKVPGAEVEDVEHWKVVQQRFIATYGTNTHAATLTIVDDTGVRPRVRDILDAVGFRHAIDTLESGDVSKMIAAYSDMRVAPHGVVSLEERLVDLGQRYGASPDRTLFEAAFQRMEECIFSDGKVAPASITHAVVENEKAALRQRDIA